MNDDFLQKKVIKSRIVSIYGLPGEWKSFIASFLSFFYWRVFSNVDFYENWKKKNKTIKSMLDIDKIEYSDNIGLLIIDEAWANVNARRSGSDRNIEFWKLAMYCRKKNIHIVIISQLERMADVYYREMSFYHFEMRSFFIWPNYLLFEATIKDRFQNILTVKTFDLIKFSNIYKYTYNTLDTSLIE